jgi:hypothetical protein
MELVGAALFKIHSVSSMAVSLRHARFWKLALQVASEPVEREGFAVFDWEVHGPRKDKYGQVAKSMTTCLRKMEANAWGVNDENIVKGLRCLYVGDEFLLRDVELDRWPSSARPLGSDFPPDRGWSVTGNRAVPPGVCGVDLP